MCLPPKGSSLGKAVGRMPYAPTCSLAGQADCSAVTLEGAYPLQTTPDISEFLRNAEMYKMRSGFLKSLRAP